MAYTDPMAPPIAAAVITNAIDSMSDADRAAAVCKHMFAAAERRSFDNLCFFTVTKDYQDLMITAHRVNEQRLLAAAGGGGHYHIHRALSQRMLKLVCAAYMVQQFTHTKTWLQYCRVFQPGPSRLKILVLSKILVLV